LRPLVELTALDHRGIPRTSPRALRSPCHRRSRTAPALEREPARKRSCSSSVQTTAFSVEPTASPADLAAVARDPQDDDHRLLGHHDAVHEQPPPPRALQPPRKVLSRSAAGSRRTTVRLTALLLLPGSPPERPRLQTGFVLARRHPGEELLHHPRAQRSPSRNTATEGNVASPPASAAREGAAPARAARRR